MTAVNTTESTVQLTRGSTLSDVTEVDATVETSNVHVCSTINRVPIVLQVEAQQTSVTTEDMPPQKRAPTKPVGKTMTVEYLESRKMEVFIAANEGRTDRPTRRGETFLHLVSPDEWRRTQFVNLPLYHLSEAQTFCCDVEMYRAGYDYRYQLFDHLLRDHAITPNEGVDQNTVCLPREFRRAIGTQYAHLCLEIERKYWRPSLLTGSDVVPLPTAMLVMQETSEPLEPGELPPSSSDDLENGQSTRTSTHTRRATQHSRTNVTVNVNNKQCRNVPMLCKFQDKRRTTKFRSRPRQHSSNIMLNRRQPAPGQSTSHRKSPDRSRSPPPGRTATRPAALDNRRRSQFYWKIK